MKAFRIIFPIILVLISMTAFADPKKEASLKEVVVIGSRHKKDVKKLPVDCRVIRESEIFHAQPDSVAQAVSQSDAGHAVRVGSPAFNTFSLHGFSGRRIILLEEGLRVDTQRSIGPTGSFMPMFDIARVEVLRGPASLAYGSGGLGGAINVVYHNPWKDRGLHGAAGTRFHTNNMQAGAWARANYAAEKWFVKAYAGYDHAGDYKSGDHRVKFSAYKNLLTGAGAGYRPAPGHQLKIRFESQVSDMGKPATVSDVANGRFTRFPKDNDYRGVAGYVYNRHNTRVETKAAFNMTQRRFQSIDSMGTVKGVKDFMSWQASGFIQVRKKIAKNNNLTTGVDVFHTVVSLDKTAKGKKKTIMSKDLQTLAGIFVIDDYNPTPKVGIMAGIRYEVGITSANSTSGAIQSAISGSIGWSYQPAPMARLHMTYGEAFRIPTIKETAATMPTPIGMFCGNKDLRPERSRELQAGIDGKNKWISYGMDVFYIMANDLITLKACDRPDCDYTYVNTEAADIIGVDGRIKAVIALGRGLSLIPGAGITYEYGVNPSTWKPVPMIPPLTISGSVFLKGRQSWHSLKWSVGGGVTSSLKQGRVVPGMEAALWQKTPEPGYNLFWAQAGAKITGFNRKNVIEMVIRAENLANTTFRDHLSANPGFGRNIRIAIRAMF